MLHAQIFARIVTSKCEIHSLLLPHQSHAEQFSTDRVTWISQIALSVNPSDITGAIVVQNVVEQNSLFNGRQSPRICRY